MDLLVRNGYRTEIILSSPELESYGITYEEIDYGNIETRRFLWTLQREIRRIYGHEISLSGRMLIEVIKDSRDYIRICFSALSDKNADDSSVKQLIKVSTAPLIAEFSDFEEMLRAVSFTDTDTESNLFEKDGKYRISFFVDEETKNQLIFSLCEFSELFEGSHKELARCNEMWKLLSENNAVNVLHGFLE